MDEFWNLSPSKHVEITWPSYDPLYYQVNENISHEVQRTEESQVESTSAFFCEWYGS